MLLGAALLRIVFLFRSLWKQANYKDRQQQLALELLRQRLQVAKARVVDREHQESSWGGYRKFVVQKIVKESSQISSFYLYPHDKKRLPPFKPGQHLTFKLRVPDVNKPVIRCYSLSDAPTQYEWYRISIKQIPPPSGSPDVPPGLVSNYFHNNVNEGDILDVKAPGGKFFLETEEQFPVVLLAGGREDTHNTPVVADRGAAAIAARYQQAIGQHLVLQFDGFGAIQEDRDLSHGGRVECRVSF